jgi:hypothetical protein
VCSALLLCGCAHVATRPAPEPLHTDLAALDTCARVLAPVALPAVTAASDARLAFERDDAALLTAHDEIEAGRSCVVDVKRRYGAAGEGRP